jgi:DNA repair photolyase
MKKNESQAGVTGTKEWAATEVNIQNGCEHDCRYCYAKCMALRFRRTTAEGWRTPVLRQRDVNRGRGKCRGTIMFPSSHDITPANVDTCAAVLEKILAAGNRVLIVSKPHLECVRKMCDRLARHRDRILFRFTIGSVDDRVLGYWEPGALAFAERLAALRYAREQGYETSVSCEPMLDANIDAVIGAVRPYTSQSIWLGRANRLVQAVTLNFPGNSQAIASARELDNVWNDEAVRGLYEIFKNDPLIRFKDLIKRVIGLPGTAEKGLDQ